MTGLVDTAPAGVYDVDLDALPSARWEMVDPVMAHEALQNMRRNRALREGRVEAIKNDILNGKWRATGETVQQGADGLWDNGQHRFTAIYRAGAAVPLLVVRGIDKDARLVLDTGASRKYTDTLTMRGISNSTFTGALTRRMWMWDHKRSYILHGGGRVQPSHETLDTYRTEHLAEIEAAAALKDDARKCWLTPTVLASAFIILRRVDEGDAVKFLDGLITGAELKRTDPRFVLRDKLRALDHLGDGTPDEKRAWVFLAWNAWRDGREISRLQPPRGGSARQPFTDKNYPLPQ